MPSPPRLTAPEQFRQVYREGTRIADERLVVHARARGTGPARVGIAVRRQLGGAVERNRVRRRLREASARAHRALPAGVDVVIVPRAEAATASFEELVASLTELFTRVQSGAHR
jgi:ribonuclease P protein component